MLDRRQRPLGGDRFQSAVDGVAREVDGVAREVDGVAREVDGSPPLEDAQAAERPALRGLLGQPRRMLAILLIVGGIVWAIVRGLHFYGASPAGIGYDLDQPPILLVLVGAWLLFRSRRA
jgi:hypothetical protein